MDFKNLRAGERRKLARNLQENVSARRIGVAGFCLTRMFMPVLALLGMAALFAYTYNHHDPNVSLALVAAPLSGKIDVALTNYSKGYSQNELISDKICPRVPVLKQTNKYWVLGREGQQVTEKILRATGNPAQQTRLSVSTDSYNCNSHALETPIADEDRANWEAGDLEQSVVSDQMDKILLAKEIECAAMLSDTNQVTNNTTLAGGDQWSDFELSKPITVIEDGKAVIRKAGVQANTLVLGDAVYTKLQNHPSIVERFKYVVGGAIGVNELKQVFKVDQILVASAVKLGLDGAEAFVWGKVAVLMYVKPTAGLKDISAAKTFVWSAAPGTIDGFGVLKGRHPQPSAKTDLLSTDMYYDQKITATGTVYLIKNAVA